MISIDDIRSRIVAVRTWAIDHEEIDKARAVEVELWEEVLRAIAGGAPEPAALAAAALESLAVAYPRR